MVPLVVRAAVRAAAVAVRSAATAGAAWCSTGWRAAAVTAASTVIARGLRGRLRRRTRSAETTVGIVRAARFRAVIDNSRADAHRRRIAAHVGAIAADSGCAGLRI